jgi:hypothetical protein
MSQGNTAGRKKWRLTSADMGVLFTAVFVGRCFLAGSPKDVYGMVRYALPHMRLAVDGKQRFYFREPSGFRQWVGAMLGGKFGEAQALANLRDKIGRRCGDVDNQRVLGLFEGFELAS